MSNDPPTVQIVGFAVRAPLQMTVCIDCPAALMCITGVAEHYQRPMDTLVIYTMPYDGDHPADSKFYEVSHAVLQVSKECPALRAKLGRMNLVYNAEEMAQLGAYWRRA